jgi:hypothetical protein
MRDEDPAVRSALEFDLVTTTPRPPSTTSLRRMAYNTGERPLPPEPTPPSSHEGDSPDVEDVWEKRSNKVLAIKKEWNGNSILIPGTYAPSM